MTKSFYQNRWMKSKTEMNIYWFQENGIEEPGCWFDTTMTSTVSEYLTLKSSMNSNTSHNLDIAITPNFDQKIKYLQKYIEGITKSYIPPLIVRGVWMKRGTEDESTQFQMFSVAFDDLRKSVAEDILPLIYRSYVRLQNYCPIVLRKRVKRLPKVYPRKGVSHVCETLYELIYCYQFQKT